MEVARPVATVLSHLSKEVPYKPNASIHKYTKFLEKSKGNCNDKKKNCDFMLNLQLNIFPNGVAHTRR